jgi:hypothetical protein
MVNSKKCESSSGQAGIWAAKAWWQHLYGWIDILEILTIIMQCREIMGITQILREQGFDDHMPVCYQIQMRYSSKGIFPGKC